MDKRTGCPLSRRDALKALAGLTGAVALSSLPSQWSTPALSVGALPAFAQCSPTPNTAAVWFVNYTDGNVVFEVFHGAAEHDSLSVGPNGFGCIDRINPGPGQVCVTVYGGSCPGEGCVELTFVAGQLANAYVTCGMGAAGGPSIGIE